MHEPLTNPDGLRKGPKLHSPITPDATTRQMVLAGTLVSFGSWPCDNAPEGVSPDRGRRDALQGDCFEFFSDFGLGAKPAPSSGRT